MKVTALLPMKGNSERVPGKNLKSFNGKPLFVHVLESLDGSNYIDEIIINTDSEKIAEVALQYSSKVKIHQRPKEICGDFVSMNDIINDDLEKSSADIFIQTHSTNPLLTSETIDNALDMFISRDETYDSIFSVTKMQTRLFWESGEAINHNPAELIRTQDLPAVYEENSNFFIFTKQSFVNAGKKRIGMKPKMFEVHKIEAVDIDEPADFEIAEALHKLNILQKLNNELKK